MARIKTGDRNEIVSAINEQDDRIASLEASFDALVADFANSVAVVKAQQAALFAETAKAEKPAKAKKADLGE